MSTTKLLLIISFFFQATALRAQHIAILGGGGEPTGETTIFDSWLDQTSKFTKTSKWDLTVAFDGGHSKTEDILAKNYPVNRSTFTPENFEKTIAAYESKIKNGQITAGEKVLLLINTHGSEQGSQEQTHRISTIGGTGLTNYNDLSGSPSISMDRLKSLSDLAEKTGVKLGIVDLSCHSGLSQKLANSKTCVISASGPTQFAYAGDGDVFGTKFAKGMRSGRNLEEIFIEARRESQDMAFPMISSPAAQELQTDLYQRIVRYQFGKMGIADKSEKDIKELYVNDQCEVETKSFGEISKLIQQMGQLTNAKYDALTKSLQDYYQFRQDIFMKMNQAQGQLLKVKKKFCTKAKDKKGLAWCMEYRGDQLDNLDFDKMIAANLSSRSPSDSKYSTALNDASLKVLQEAQVWKNELVSKGADLKFFANIAANIPNYEKTTQKLANEVSKHARKLYDDLYKARANTPGANPCREFQL